MQILLPDEDMEILEALLQHAQGECETPMSIEEAREAYFRRRDAEVDDILEHTGELPAVGGV